MNSAILKKIDDFFIRHKHQHFKKGEIIIRADDDPSGIFYLKEGLVRQYAIMKKGDEVVVNIFKSSAFFPISWAINNAPNTFFYEAMTDLNVWRAPREDVIAFLKDNPDVLYDLLSRVFRGVDGMLTRMTYLMSGDAYTRLIIELLIYARRFEKEQNSIAMIFSEKDLAAFSGMTRETVSREMKILKDKGLITMQKNKLVIEDVKKLEQELQNNA